MRLLRKAHSVLPNLLNKPFPASNSRSITGCECLCALPLLPTGAIFGSSKIERRDASRRALSRIPPRKRVIWCYHAAQTPSSLREARSGAYAAQQAIVCTIRLLALPPRPSDFRIPLCRLPPRMAVSRDAIVHLERDRSLDSSENESRFWNNFPITRYIVSILFHIGVVFY